MTSPLFKTMALSLLALSFAISPAFAGQQLIYSPGGALEFYDPVIERLSKASSWSVTVGGGGAVAPRYEGSDRLEFLAQPIFHVSFDQDMFFLGTRGIGITPLRGKNYNIALGFAYDFGRREKDDRRNLSGMGDVDGSGLGFLSGDYAFGMFSVGGNIKSSFGGDYGTTASANFAAQKKFGRFHAKGDLHLRLADTKHMKSYFGVNATQAAASGKNVFAPDWGLKSLGLGIGMNYALTNSWSVNFATVTDWLVSDAADSPLSVDNFQPSVFLGIAYRM